jgi:hypothetical protein
MSRPQRWTLALILIAHALAHSLPGMRALDGVPGWLTGDVGLEQWGAELWATLLLALTMGSLLAGGLGVLGATPFRNVWRRLALLGALSSAVLLLGYQPPLALPGTIISAAVLGVVPWLGDGWDRNTSSGFLRRSARGLRSALAGLVVAYTTIAIVSRPWYMRWGSTNEELGADLPGDEFVETPVRYSIQHAVTIDAPPSAVWPWLVQIGQDRAGFYSLAWLERIFGADIRNSDVVLPEWQHRVVGDSVFATQPGYLGLFEGRLGWRVALVEPARALVLEKWGAFVLVPEGPNSSRLIVRTRGGGTEQVSLGDVLMGPLGLLAFELPHFVMERGMLLGIKERAEVWQQRRLSGFDANP